MTASALCHLDFPVHDLPVARQFYRGVIESHIRFPGLPGEQATMFFLDPSGNALEFKAFSDLSQVFAK